MNFNFKYKKEIKINENTEALVVDNEDQILKKEDQILGVGSKAIMGRNIFYWTIYVYSKYFNNNN
ncbi:hypothetical protein G9F72_006885 [Clostridium estertheticum]|uniref:hypothetical protein n=1 Tax=Clostridium estertheticum TaxID=238834 RepID=UPI001CD0FE67|nr:hypothetical protein [Clostridium estertheticum]MBZ9686059.1 hypothetical protein [Clostridium estertheticum]